MVSSQAEVEWDDTERTWMLGLQEWRDHFLCPRCGGPKELCQGPGAEERFKVNPPRRCHLTTALLQAQKEWADNPNRMPHDQALMFSVGLKDAEPNN